MLELTPAERRKLRAQAHALHPVVFIGQHGATAAAMHEIDVALLAHELIKVRVFVDDRAERETLRQRMCSQLGCAPVQHIGKILVLWRPNPEKEVEPEPPRRAGKPRGDRAPGKPRVAHDSRRRRTSRSTG